MLYNTGGPEMFNLCPVNFKAGECLWLVSVLFLRGLVAMQHTTKLVSLLMCEFVCAHALLMFAN